MVKKGSTLTGSGIGKKRIRSMSYVLFYLAGSGSLEWSWDIEVAVEKFPDYLMREIMLLFINYLIFIRLDNPKSFIHSLELLGLLFLLRRRVCLCLEQSGD